MTYLELVNKICVMDEKQLIELFHDLVAIGSLQDIERIADTAYYYVENYEETAPNEFFEADCTQRNRDLADEQKRGY